MQQVLAQTLRLTTGRQYDGMQELVIEVPAYEYDANGDASVVVKFTDASRHIAGLVTLQMWQDINDNPRDIERAVFVAYDHGHYAQL